MIPPFESKIHNPVFGRTLERLDILQVNVGRLCNLSCKHCHMEAGPGRTEVMTRETMEHVLRVLKSWGFRTLDITGGAPEMNPHYQWLVEEGVKSGAHVMTRSNLVILGEPGYEHLPEFFAQNGVEVVASLPYYTERDCNRQRGEGTFTAVIAMLKKLNSLGYGREGHLPLDLVYNPGGAFLPPGQSDLEREYRDRLKTDYGIEFTRLFAITNNPIGRFGDFLKRTGNFDRYMQRLCGAFNPAALEGMMCRFQLSVAWDGGLYDCDFNQAAGLPIKGPANIRELGDSPEAREIAFGPHCYACTAGAGSSCGGTTA
ncbi:MAG: arsenosugar biosynthesis radical SAM protein ArsS [Fretibacterium sp.]|nr:arsenosugar biosynthesis radical SAM protein ArsS [Fretibacterium sp.]